MYESTFHCHTKRNSLKKNILSSLKGKRKMTSSCGGPENRKSTQQPSSCSSEPVPATGAIGFNSVLTPVENVNEMDLHTSVGYRETSRCERTPPLMKPFLQRGKSDIRSDRGARRHTESGVETLHNCRTEFALPGEFLFCSLTERNNNFISLYGKISNASNLRRTMSMGTLRKPPELSKTDFDHGAPNYPNWMKLADDRRLEFRAARSISCVTPQLREKWYPEKKYPPVAKSVNINKDACKRQSREILAGELQSILDKKQDGMMKGSSCRRKNERITSFFMDESNIRIDEGNDTTNNDNRYNNHSNNYRNSNKNDNKDDNNNNNSNANSSINDDKCNCSISKEEERDLINRCDKVSSSTRSKASRRSQSCKSSQKHSHSLLFDISKYLRDRNTQRSKSFATIREFSNNDKKKLYFDKKDNRRSCHIHMDSDGYDATDGQCVSSDRKTRDSKHLELTPTKTTRSFHINHTDARGNSCLHHASSNGDISTIKYLLAQGGDVWVKNDDHRLPVDVARNFQTAKLLSSATLFYSEQNEQRNERNILQTSKLNIAL